MKFKPMLEWLKANLWIVVFSALVVLLLPASFYVSRMWNKKILAEQQKVAGKEYDDVMKSSVDYNLPQFDAKVNAVSVKSVPNAKLTEHFKKAREAATGQVGVVAKAATDFNRGVGSEAAAVGRSEFKPLVEGLFPKVAMTPEEAKDAGAARDKEQAKLNEFEDKILGKRGNPNPYVELLKKINAGPPENNDNLFQLLRDQRKREEEKITQNKRKLDEKETKELNDRIVGARLGTYKQRANSQSVYMTPEAFPLPIVGEGGQIRPGVASENAELIEPFANVAWGAIDRKNLARHKMFMHQWDLWVLSDLLSAVRLANTGPDGKQLNIETGVVKRVESIVLRNPEGMKTLDPKPIDPNDTSYVPPTPPTPPTETTPGIAALDKNVSITGHARGGWNKYYEVRTADMTCVVSSARLQDFLKAIAQTNYMTVIDLDIDNEVDIWGDLENGYYYGNEHVVRARVTVESLWFKEWLVPLMPTEVQVALGMEVPAEPAPDAAPADPNAPTGATPPAAPPPGGG